MTRSPFLPPTAMNTAADHQTITHEDISARARELWIGQGCPENRDTAIWLEAEAELRAMQAGRFRHPNLRCAD